MQLKSNGSTRPENSGSTCVSRLSCNAARRLPAGSIDRPARSSATVSSIVVGTTPRLTVRLVADSGAYAVPGAAFTWDKTQEQLEALINAAGVAQVAAVVADTGVVTAVPAATRPGESRGGTPAHPALERIVGGKPTDRKTAEDAGRKASFFCANCHGETGNSKYSEVPNLASQHPAYVLNQIEAFLSGKRKDAFMQGLMKVLSNDEKVGIAVFYASQEVVHRPARDAALAPGTAGSH